MEKLDAKQRQVVERRFGLQGYERSTREHVARELGVTCERVRQTQIGALKQLRSILEKRDLRSDICDRCTLQSR